MKSTKRFASLMLVVALIMAMAVPAFAAGPGSITINSNTTTGVSVDGKTFNAYKILNVESYSGDKVTYSVPSVMRGFYEAYFTLASPATDGEIVAAIEGLTLAKDIEEFARQALEEAILKLTPEGSASGASDKAEIQNLPLGYYLVEETTTDDPVSAVMLSTTKPSADVNLKADLPTLEKEFDVVVGDPKVGNASIGDEVNFKLTSKVPDMTGYNHYYFVVHDSLDPSLDFDDTSLVIKVDGVTVNPVDYTVEATGTTDVRIIFHDFLDNYMGQAGDSIVITYTATLNDDALVGGSVGNENEAYLKYSNNPKYDYDGNKDPGKPDDPEEPGTSPPTGETPKEKTTTFTTSLTINKVAKDENDILQPLTGAKFKITGTTLNRVLTSGIEYVAVASGTHYQLDNGTYAEIDANMPSGAQEYDKVAYSRQAFDSTAVDVEAFVDDNGVLVFEGLGEGTYTIEETVTPAGYNGIANKTLIVSFDSGTGQFSYKLDGVDLGGSGNELSIDIENLSGSVLPETGGIGTTIFYALGSILVLGAIVFFIARRRMAEENKH